MSETRYVATWYREYVWSYASAFQRYGVGVTSAVLILECVLFVTIAPATEFETSLVNALPMVYWICFYTVLAGGILTLAASAATRSGYWRHGLALVLANYALFVFLPKARGYRHYGQGTADAFVHIGDVKEILTTGLLPGNWYPAEHILISELTMLGLPLNGVKYLTAFLFTAIHIVGIGVLVGVLTGQRRGFVAGVAAGVPLVFSTFHLTNHPAINSFMLVPALLVVVERYRQTSATGYLALFLLLILTIIYFHPMTTLFVVAILFAIAAYTYGHEYLTSVDVPKLSPRLPAVPLVLLFAWLVDFDTTVGKIRTVLYADQAPIIASEIDKATTVSFTPVELLGKFVGLYGAQFLYALIGGAFAVFVVRTFVRDQSRFRFEWGLTTTLFALGAGIAAAFFFQDLIVDGRIRAARVLILFATLLVGMALLYIIRQRRVRLAVVVTVVVLLAAGLGANATYEPNRHMTYAEYDGTQFLVANYELGTDIHAFNTREIVENFVFGSNHPRVEPGDSGFDPTNNIPPELGYRSEGTTAADTFGRSYVVTKTYDIKQYTAEYFTEDQRAFRFVYGPEHIDRLSRDRTANKVYANGGFTSWQVTPPDGETGQ